MVAIYFEALKSMPLKDIDHCNFGSDLYLRVTPKSKALINQYEYKNLVHQFVDNIDHELWYDVPFAFPYKIFEDLGYKTKIWTFSHYDEKGNHVYTNGLPNVGRYAEFYREIVVTDFSKYKIYM